MDVSVTFIEASFGSNLHYQTWHKPQKNPRKVKQFNISYLNVMYNIPQTNN